MKKLFKGLLIFLFILVLITVGGVGFAIYSINDNSDSTPENIRRNNYPTEKIANRLITDSLISNDEDIVLLLDGHTTNELLYSIFNSLKIGPAEIVGFYSSFDKDSNFEVQIPLSIYGYRTTINGTLKLTEQDTTFSLQLIDGSLGKTSLSSGFIKYAISNRKSEDNIEKELKGNGIEANVDLSNYTISITKESLIDKLKEVLKDDKNSSLYSLLISLCIEKPELFQLHLCENQRIGFTIKASNMKYDATRDGSFDNMINYTEAINNLNTDLENGRIDYTNVSAAFDYQIIGYDNLSDKEKEKIDSLGYSKSYKGQVHYTQNTMKTFIHQQEPNPTEIANIILKHELTMSVSEEQFNELFSAMNFVGKSFGFTNDKDIGYFSFETLYVSIEKDTITLSIILNASGRRIIITGIFNAPKNEDFKIDATLSKLRIGNVEIEEKYYKELLKYINDSMESSEWINATPSENKITIDLESIIKSGSSFKELESHLVKKSIEFTADKKLKITYKL